jgi:dTDP-4-dehydrorhamnose 3,5-epimerase
MFRPSGAGMSRVLFHPFPPEGSSHAQTSGLHWQSCERRRLQPLFAMNKIETGLRGVLLLEPRVFGDDRGFFLESYNEKMFAEAGISTRFVQDNHSYSGHNVIRGLHYQIQRPQGKLVLVVTGEILDAVVDLRRSSPSFGKWECFRLSGENKRMLWVPAGLAHGFRVVSDTAHVLYKATDFYAPEYERTLAWNDPQLKIDWQLDGDPIVSPKDERGAPFAQAEKFD